MRVHSHPEIASVQEAYALLGLSGPVEGEALTAAFRAAVKAARPDHEGGDDDRFRRVIAAWRLLREEARRPAAVRGDTPALPVVCITPLDALRGGSVLVEINGRTLKVRAPKGLRSGDRLRLKRAGDNRRDLDLPVLIRGDGGLTALGNDLYMDWPVQPRLLEDGGRVEIDTHAGPRSVWIVADQEPLRIRLKDLGLPARGHHPQGHLFVTLKPCAETPSAAEDLLVRFTRVWTPDRMAA